MKRPPEQVDGLAKALAERSLRHFIKKGWRYIDPADYIGNWHIDAMCEHLEGVMRGEIRHLIINVPPRHMKSLSVSVSFPAFVWAQTPIEGLPLMGPQVRFLGTSYAQSLSARDNMKCRRLILSDWYQQNWGDRFALTSDQNSKIRFENDAQGYRIATSVDGTATGEGGDIILIDDPLSAKEANSETARQGVITWWDETMSTRLNDPKTGSYIVIMQRLHELDLVGHILSREHEDFTVLCLPARYEHNHPSVYPLDPRTEEGELLWKERMGEPEVRKLEINLGSYATAGQLQQRPAPREGGLFKRADFGFIKAVPTARSMVRSWDFAATAPAPNKKPDWTAGVKMSRLRDGRFVIENIQRRQDRPGAVRKLVKQTAVLDTVSTHVTVPEDPGSAGVAVADDYILLLAGFVVKKIRPTGDKAARAEPLAAQVEAGNVLLLRTGDPDRDAWIEPFLAEVEVFPAGANDDQVDAAADAFNTLAPTGGADMWIKHLDAQLAEAGIELPAQTDEDETADG